MEFEYRYVTTSLIGFVQFLAANILPHGYWFYVTGYVREGKDACASDRKLIDKYGIAVSRQHRYRRKLAGLGNLHYLRFDRNWILLATKGEHLFRTEEAVSIRDVRKVPIQIGNYSISVTRGGYLQKEEEDDEPVIDGKWRVRVRIARERYLDLRAYFLSVACHRSPDKLASELWNLPFEPYAPIRRQFLRILRLVNEKRQSAGYSEISPTVLRYRRRIVRPFCPVDFANSGDSR